MIVHYKWKVVIMKRTPHFSIPVIDHVDWKEGWFLFGVIPLYVRTLEVGYPE